MATRSSTPRLDPGLIARKGEAVPAATAPPADRAAGRHGTDLHGREQGADASTPRGEAGEARRGSTPRGPQGTIAVTVRLDPERYERLKVFGARRRRTNQEILVEALDGFLRGQPD